MTQSIAPSKPESLSGNRREDAFGYDAYQGFRAWRLWSALGWNDIRQRYRRSVLGPFWITISMAVLVAVLGYIYSHIFKMEIQTYLPFLALGFIFWGFLSSTITECCEAFRENNQIIKQIKVPYSVHILRVLWRNLIVLLHTISIFIPISIVFSLMPSPDILLVIPGLLMLCINLAWLGLFLAVLSTRFRDVSLIVATIVQIAIFATPIMWPVSSVGDNTFIVDINPVYHLIDLVRAPLLGQRPAQLSWIVSIGMALGGSLLALRVFQRSRRQIVYWL